MDMLFGLDFPAEQEGLALLRTFYDEVSLSIALEVLGDNEIPHLKKDRGTGNVVRILTGFSMYGVDVYVRPEDLERAAALMDELFSGEEAENAEEEHA